MAKIIKSKTDKKPVAKKPVEKAIKPVETKKETVYAVAKYHNKNLMISPRKLRLLANSIKKLSPGEALLRLKFTNTKAARILVKSIQNVIADAKNNFNLDTNTLKFDTIQVDEGLKIKRMDKSHGSRFARGLIMKRHSRLILNVKGIQK
jgi:large subunit ribosomal protein L22